MRPGRGGGTAAAAAPSGSAQRRAPPPQEPRLAGQLLPAPTPTSGRRLLLAGPTSTSVNQLPNQPRVFEATARMPLPAAPAPPVPPRGSRTSPSRAQSPRGPVQPGPGRRDEPWEDTVGGKRRQDQEVYMMLSVYLHVSGLGEQKGVLRGADPPLGHQSLSPGSRCWQAAALPDAAPRRQLAVPGQGQWAVCCRLRGAGRGPQPREEQPAARVRCCSRAFL